MVNDSTNGVVLKANSVWELLKTKLTAKAIEKLENKVDKLESDEYSVRFLGSRNIDTLARNINEYSEGLNMVGSLENAIELELFDGSKVYLSYIAFVPASAKIIDELIKLKNSGFIENGECP